MFVVSWPVMLYSKYKIKSESLGTSMFKQMRVGQNNKEFKCVKFRSMKLDVEINGAQFSSKDDERIFRWGRDYEKISHR